jgi:ubiquitin C-terminal hydrolase
MGCIIPKSPKHESCITPTPTIPLSEASEGQFSKSSYKFVHKEVTEKILKKNSSQGIIGLKNLGNTCFMNSALQCLSNTVPLVDYFLGYCWTNELNLKNPVGTGGIVAEQFGYLISRMWSGAIKGSAISPLDFKKAISSFRSQFRGNSQHDSHEFLAFLLDGLHEDLNRVHLKPSVEEIDSDGKRQEDVAVEAWKAYLLRNRSIIVDIFQGQLRNILCCLSCQYQSFTFDPFMYMTVPIGVRNGRISLYDCLAEFCKPEILTFDCQVSRERQWRERETVEQHPSCVFYRSGIVQNVRCLVMQRRRWISGSLRQSSSSI